MPYREKIRNMLFSLIDLIDASSEEKMHYKPASDSWNMLECIEHIILVNSNVSKVIQTPPPPSSENKLNELYSEGKLNYLLVTKRDVMRAAPERVVPKGIFKTAAEAKEVIYRDTEFILHLLDQTDISTQTHTIPHLVLGDMTKMDWIYFMLSHTQRHLLQLEDMKNKYKNL